MVAELLNCWAERLSWAVTDGADAVAIGCVVGCGWVWLVFVALAVLDVSVGRVHEGTDKAAGAGW